MNAVSNGARRTIALGCLVGSLCVHEQNARAVEPSVGVGLVDALNGVFGKQTDGRAIHAKGIVLEGTFKPAADAPTLSKAPHLHGRDTPVTVRFSDFAGIPTVADTDGLATPRGMAIKFHLHGGAETDLVAHSVNGFPCATAEEFRQLMVAISSSGPGTQKPTPADTFMASHAAAKAFFDGLPPPPVSFATVTYFGVNSFKFTNTMGEARFGRYQLIPLAGTHYLMKGETADAGHDYLAEELKRRVTTQSVQFLLQVQLSSPGDVIDDPSTAWRDSNPIVKVGTITITHVIEDSDLAQRALLFTPAAVTDGIDSADPMIEARNAAYGVSYGRRHQ